MAGMHEPLMDIGQHVVEGDHLPRELEVPQLRAGLLQQATDQSQARQGERGVEALAHGKIRFGLVEEGVHRRNTILLLVVLEHPGAIQPRLALHVRNRALHDRKRLVFPDDPVPLPGPFLHGGVLVGLALQGAQRCTQPIDDGAPLSQPGLADLAVKIGQGVRVDQRRFDVRGPEELGQRLRQVTLEQLRELVGAIAPGRQIKRKARRHRFPGDMPSPVVVDRLHQELVVILHEFHVHRQAGREGIVRQRALTEPVDGEDGGFVEGFERAVQEFDAGAAPAGLVDRRGKPGDEGIVRRTGLLRQRIAQFPDPRADALTQFRGRGLRERHHENLPNGELALEEQPHIQAADGPGLAGSGRRFDEIDAVQGTVKNIHGAHDVHGVDGVPAGTASIRGSSRHARIPPKTIRVDSSKFESIGLSWPRKASRYAASSLSPRASPYAGRHLSLALAKLSVSW